MSIVIFDSNKSISQPDCMQYGVWYSTSFGAYVYRVSKDVILYTQRTGDTGDVVELETVAMAYLSFPLTKLSPGFKISFVND